MHEHLTLLRPAAPSRDPHGISSAFPPEIALFLLEVTGQVAAPADAYFQVTVHSAFAIGFAYTGANLVYGLGREVTAAREFGSYHLVELVARAAQGDATGGTTPAWG